MADWRGLGRTNATHKSVDAEGVSPRASSQHAPQRDAETEEFIKNTSFAELMYGARATSGRVELRDIEQVLRIKTKYLQAIENVDPDNLPSEAYLAAFVKSYARFLQAHLPITPDEALAKFNEELQAKLAARAPQEEPAEQTPSPAPKPEPKAKKISLGLGKRANDAKTEAQPPKRPMTAPEIIAARQQALKSGRPVPKIVAAPAEPAAPAAKPRLERAKTTNFDAAETLSGATPFLMAGGALLVAGGVLYGGWSLLLSAQRLGSQTPQTDVTVLETRDPLNAPSVSRPAAAAYEDGGALAAAYAPPKAVRADGPILQINPDEVGAFGPQINDRDAAPGPSIVQAPAAGPVISAPAAPDSAWSPPEVAAPLTDAALTPPSEGSAETPPQQAPAVEDATIAPAQTPQEEPAAPAAEEAAAPPEIATAEITAPAGQTKHPPRFAVRALEEVWVRVRDASGATVYTGVLPAGAMAELPTDLGPLELRSGSAGSTAVVIRGEAFGPVGPRGLPLTVSIAEVDVVTNFSFMPEVTEQIAIDALSTSTQELSTPAQ